MAVDLHLHSTASDGSLTPTEIASRAARIGLAAISLTDHDSVAGIAEAEARCGNLKVDFIPGVELSSELEGRDVHILGYFIDAEDMHLNAVLAELRRARVDRAKLMIDKLAGLGLNVEYEKVKATAKGGAVGRPHVAQVMVSAGHVKDIGEAFDRFIGRDCPAYVSKHVLSVTDIIDLVHKSGGATSVAHPGLSRIDAKLLGDLRDAGLDAVEVWHTDHSPDQQAHFLEAAKRCGLLVTGGSDCHGFGKSRGFVLGSAGVPDSVIGPLRAKAIAIKSAKISLDET